MLAYILTLILTGMLYATEFPTPALTMVVAINVLSGLYLWTLYNPYKMAIKVVMAASFIALAMSTAGFLVVNPSMLFSLVIIWGAVIGYAIAFLYVVSDYNVRSMK